MDRKVSIQVKIFVLFHMFAITVWAIPRPPNNVAQNEQDLRNGLRKPNPLEAFSIWNRDNLLNGPTKYYTWSTGTWQYWDMFSPNPMATDKHCTAEITYKDGTTKTYRYPRMFDLSIPEKYILERYRKFYERAGDDQKTYLWPVFAQRIALKNWDDPQNPPVKVVLHRFTRIVLGPGLKPLTNFNDDPYFEYVVDENSLKKAAELEL